MKGSRYIFLDIETNRVVDGMKLPDSKAAIRRAAQLSKTMNTQIVVFRGIAIVDERPSMAALFEMDRKPAPADHGSIHNPDDYEY
jgi:hypothetical protein